MADRTLFESWNPVTRRSTELVLDEETGLSYIVHAQDLKPIIAHCKQLSANFQGTNKQDITHVASIPLVIYRQWEALGITKDEQLLKRELEKPENRVFRTDGGRKL